MFFSLFSKIKGRPVSQTLTSFFRFCKAPHLVPAVEKCILYFLYDSGLSYSLTLFPSTTATDRSFYHAASFTLSPTELHKLFHSRLTTHQSYVDQNGKLNIFESLA